MGLFPLGGGEVGFFSFDLYSDVMQAETKKEQKEYFCSAHVTVHLLDLAPCGLRDISLVITR